MDLIKAMTQSQLKEIPEIALAIRSVSTIESRKDPAKGFSFSKARLLPESTAASARPLPSAVCPTVLELRRLSRFIPPTLPRLKSFAAVRSAVRSFTICVAELVRQQRSNRISNSNGFEHWRGAEASLCCVWRNLMKQDDNYHFSHGDRREPEPARPSRGTEEEQEIFEAEHWLTDGDVPAQNRPSDSLPNDSDPALPPEDRLPPKEDKHSFDIRRELFDCRNPLLRRFSSLWCYLPFSCVRSP